jgi:hypothetical protein
MVILDSVDGMGLEPCLDLCFFVEDVTLGSPLADEDVELVLTESVLESLSVDVDMDVIADVVRSLVVVSSSVLVDDKFVALSSAVVVVVVEVVEDVVSSVVGVSDEVEVNTVVSVSMTVVVPE